MGTGNKPRDLYPGNQGGTSSGHGRVTMVGRGGGSPKDQARSIGHAQAMAKAMQAVNSADTANNDAAVPRSQVNEMVDLATTLVEHLEGGGGSTGASSSGEQAGAGTGSSRMSVEMLRAKGGKKGGLTAEEVEAHYAAKGKRKGKSKPVEDPATDEAATDEAEESEESPQGLDPIVEGRDDDAEDGGGVADGAETLSHPGTGTGHGNNGYNDHSDNRDDGHRANLPPELEIAPTGTTMVPLPTVDEEVPADDNTTAGDNATADDNAPEENNTPENDDIPAENEVPVNDEADHGTAGTLEEEEQPRPPRVHREEGEHGMGPPPTRWDQGDPSCPPRMPQKGGKGGQVLLHGQRPQQGAQPWFQQCGGKGAGLVQQPYMQRGPPGPRGQDARILQAQAQQWEAICKLNAAMGMLPPRPVPVQLLRPPTPGVGIPGVDYSIALRPLPPLPPPSEERHHGGVMTTSKAAGTTQRTTWTSSTITGAEAAASGGNPPVQEVRPMASAPRQQMMGVPMTMTTATTQAPEARSCGTTLAHMIRMTTELRTGTMAPRPISPVGLRTVVRPHGLAMDCSGAAAHSDDPEVVQDDGDGDELQEISSQETVTEVVSSTSKSS
eukprot:s70_g15.t1